MQGDTTFIANERHTHSQVEQGKDGQTNTHEEGRSLEWLLLLLLIMTMKRRRMAIRCKWE
jgi:hypothetical protein